jgi:energy-coupling factor transport system permease protein
MMLAGIARSFVSFFLRRMLIFVLLIFFMGVGVTWLFPSSAGSSHGPAVDSDIEQVATTVSRLILFMGAILLLVRTTSPREIAAEIASTGVSPQLAFIIATSIQAIPLIEARGQRVVEAQRARGIDWKGGYLRRLKLLSTLLAPIFQSLILETESRSLALLCRGFGRAGKRTSFLRASLSRADYALRWVSALVVLTTLAIRFWR